MSYDETAAARESSITPPQPSLALAARIDAAFARARDEGRICLIPYVMAGYPDVAASEALALGLARAGADVLEIGIPFSDPLADGATIQHAGQVALNGGMTPGGVLELAERIHAQLDMLAADRTNFATLDQLNNPKPSGSKKA